MDFKVIAFILNFILTISYKLSYFSIHIQQNLLSIFIYNFTKGQVKYYVCPTSSHSKPYDAF